MDYLYLMKHDSKRLDLIGMTEKWRARQDSNL